MNDNKEQDYKTPIIFAYLIPIFTGIAVYLMFGEKDRNLRFHAIQAIIYGLVIVIIFNLPGFLFSNFYLSFVKLGIGILAWVYGLYVGYQGYIGNVIYIPVIGEMAKKA